MVPLLPLFAAVTLTFQGTPAPVVVPKTPQASLSALTAQLNQLANQTTGALVPMSAQLAVLGSQLESLLSTRWTRSTLSDPTAPSFTSADSAAPRCRPRRGPRRIPAIRCTAPAATC